MEKKTAKKPVSKIPVKKPVKTAAKAPYFFAIGRRKTAEAKIKLWAAGSGEFTVNDREFGSYFPTLQLQKSASDPLTLTGLWKKVKVQAQTHGGGLNAQSQALGLGLSRALLKLDPNLRLVLKKSGLLTRDARKKERKKPGLKRARRAPQWQKR